MVGDVHSFELDETTNQLQKNRNSYQIYGEKAKKQ